MSKNKIEQVIEVSNQTFEFYFEEFPDIDEDPIWWIYDPDSKKLIHVCNKCQKAGDLAVHYYRHGYCAIYAKMIKELFPEGTILNNERHMIFFYQNEYYDAGGKIDPENVKDYWVTKPEDLESFLTEFRETKSNIELKNLMLTEGRKVLENNRTRERKIETDE